MINLSKEQIVEEVDKEMATGKHKYLWLAKDEVSKKFNINLYTLDGYYYAARKRKPFVVQMMPIVLLEFQVNALDENEAKVLARRQWKKENSLPEIIDVQEVIIKTNEGGKNESRNKNIP